MSQVHKHRKLHANFQCLLILLIIKLCNLRDEFICYLESALLAALSDLICIEEIF